MSGFPDIHALSRKADKSRLPDCQDFLTTGTCVRAWHVICVVWHHPHPSASPHTAPRHTREGARRPGRNRPRDPLRRNHPAALSASLARPSASSARGRPTGEARRENSPPPRRFPRRLGRSANTSPDGLLEGVAGRVARLNHRDVEHAGFASTGSAVPRRPCVTRDARTRETTLGKGFAKPRPKPLSGRPTTGLRCGVDGRDVDTGRAPAPSTGSA